MFHVKQKCYVKNSCLKLGILHVRPEHPEDVFSHGSILVRSVNVHTSVVLIMVVCVITIHSHHRKCSDETDTLSENIVYIQVGSLIIV